MSLSLTHEQVQELLGAYLTDGLGDADRGAVEAHLKLCAACNAALNEMRGTDAAMMELFHGARPSDAMVKRVARGKWSSPWRINHVKLWRATTAVAAALLLGGVGYVGTQIVEGAPLPWQALVGGEAPPAPIARDSGLGYGNSAMNGEGWGLRYKEGEERESKQRGDINGREAVVNLDAISLEYIQEGKKLLDGKNVTENFATHEVTDLTLGNDKRSGARSHGDGLFDGSKALGYGWGRPTSSSGGVAAETERVRAAEAAGKVADLQKRLDAVTREYRFSNEQHAQWHAKATKLQQLPDDARAKTKGDASGPVDLYNYTAQGLKEQTATLGVTLDDSVVAKDAKGLAPFGVPAGGVAAGPGSGAEATGLASHSYFAPTDGGVVANRPITLGTAVITDGSVAAGDAVKLNSGFGMQAGQGKASGGTLAVRGTQLGKSGNGTLFFDATKELNDVEAKLAQAGDGEKSKVSETPAPRTPEATPPANNTQTPPPPEVKPPAVVQQRKIIRNGELEFEVDSFDSAFVTVNRIATEDGGYVQSTNSEKLPNGKVRGSIILRVPPDRLDTLVLKLRALGELKSQKIAAQDVTKMYYDLESELRAARAMEERLLNIIKSGKGEIKDLLEAEKQLGTYREKIEKIEGEVRYYNNLVSLSTLTITAFERDIRAAAIVAQTETVSMGMEAEDVEKSRADALKAIEEAKGRVIDSSLKKHDAGQFSATVVAEVSPDAAGPLIDRLKQLGKVARLDIDRKQSNEGKVVLPGMKIERKDTRFAISIYNLANIAPRQTTNMNVAVTNVEEAYRAILKSVSDRNGRIVTSTLNRQKPEQTTASVSFEVPSAEAEAALADLRAQRDVMSMTVTENPDTQNVTGSKRGFAVQIYSLATVPPRESEQIVIAVKGKVADSFRTLVTEATRADSRILVSQLNEQDKAGVGGTLDLEVLRGKDLDLKQIVVSLGDVITRSVSRSPDAENRVDSKVGLQVRLVSIDNMAPRETQSMSLAASDVPMAYARMVMALGEANARVITSQLNEQDRRNITGTLDFEVLRTEREKVEKALGAAGVLYARTVNRSSDTQNTVDSKVRLTMNIINVAQLPPRESSRLGIIVSDVSASVKQVQDFAAGVGGRVNDSQLATDASGRVSGTVIIDVPLAAGADVRARVEQLGEVRVRETATNPGSPEGQIGRAQISVTLGNREMLVGKEEGLGATLHNALQTSVKGLLGSLKVLVVGLLFVGPWAIFAWVGWKLWKRSRKPAVAPASA